MKANIYFLFLLFILVNGCAGNKKKEQGGKDPVETKEDKPIDFAAHRMENLNASGNMKDILCQTWDYKEDVADAVDADPNSSDIDMVYRGFCIFSDGTMIKDQRGVMKTGKWTLDEKEKPITISFALDNGETETYQLAYLAPYQMKLAKAAGDKKTIIDLGSEALKHIDLKNDPFYISNNAWRFKPGKPESDEQIKQRLKDCIHFFILFYEQKINAQSDIVSFIGLPSCFKWYGGGIYLQKQHELQEKWVSSFYNKEQAMKAYKLADKLISQKYTWPKKEYNWLKQNLFVLKQMETRIDSL